VGLPDGFSVGHSTDRDGWTGCTVILAPDGAVAAGEVRGGGPGTREGDLLSPASTAPGVQALVLTGGSAFGLGAAEGVMRWLEERDLGYETPAARVPLVAGAVVYDLMLGDGAARPSPADGYAACEVARPEPERGTVGAGTGCTVGKLGGPGSWTKGGVGVTSLALDGATVAALAVVNAFGEVVGEDGAVIAGVWRDGGYVRTVDLILAGEIPARSSRESTTLVCLLTDAALTKTEAWLAARAASAGLARAVDPSSTVVDGDFACCLSSASVTVDPLALSAVAAEAATLAIRDAVRQATGAPSCPAARDRPSRLSPPWTSAAG
jgi:L-aminopeptidase/D-esterase-like protein